ncbi:MAG: hypothetical protein JWO32_1076 [Bacteroidetes bacterium]|nr:hypothetical protein [Bacteroidota bacterium]
MERKVLFISSWYPNPSDKTHGIFVKRYAEAIALYNRVAVIHPIGHESFQDEIKIESRTENNVFEVFVYFKKKKINPFRKFSNYKKHYLLGLDYLLKNWEKPEILQVNVAFPSGIAGLALAKKLNVPLVVSEHWTGYLLQDGSYKGFIKKHFTKLLIKNASKIITVTHNLKERMIAHGLKANYSVIPNVVDTNIFNYSGMKNESKFRFLHVSSLETRQKNVDAIIETFKKLNTEFPECELYIVGERTNMLDLEINAGFLLNKSIFFVGQKLGSELAEQYKSAHCLVMFSNYENLPVVILEALCCGIPVISSNVGGISEWVNDQSGYLVGAGNTSELLSVMKKILVEHEKFNSKKISENASSNFNYKNICRLFSNVYEEVLHSKN